MLATQEETSRKEKILQEEIEQLKQELLKAKK
jgi:hypothetical protein